MKTDYSQSLFDASWCLGNTRDSSRLPSRLAPNGWCGRSKRQSPQCLHRNSPWRSAVAGEIDALGHTCLVERHSMVTRGRKRRRRRVARAKPIGERKAIAKLMRQHDSPRNDLPRSPSTTTIARITPEDKRIPGNSLSSFSCAI